MYIKARYLKRFYFHKGFIPKSWKLYDVPKNLTIGQWKDDFIKRIDQMLKISKHLNENGHLKVLFLNRKVNISNIF